MKRILSLLSAGALLAGGLTAADGPWPWSGAYSDKAVTLLLLGDVSVEQRADPANAMLHVRET
jgi:hypothetical protein